jgi:hypothetical protein
MLQILCSHIVCPCSFTILFCILLQDCNLAGEAAVHAGLIFSNPTSIGTNSVCRKRRPLSSCTLDWKQVRIEINNFYMNSEFPFSYSIECITFIMNSMHNVYNEVSSESSRCMIVRDGVCF